MTENVNIQSAEKFKDKIPYLSLLPNNEFNMHFHYISKFSRTAVLSASEIGLFLMYKRENISHQN